MEGGIYKAASETDFHELRDTISTLNEGTNSLVMSESEPDGWFIVCRHKTSAIKFAMAGCQDWWHQFPPLLVYRFYIYSKNILGQRNLSDSFRWGLFTVPARY